MFPAAAVWMVLLCSERSDSEWRSREAHVEVESSTSPLKWLAFMLHIVLELEERAARVQKTSFLQTQRMSIIHHSARVVRVYDFIKGGCLWRNGRFFFFFTWFLSKFRLNLLPGTVDCSQCSVSEKRLIKVWIHASGCSPLCWGQGTCQDMNLAVRLLTVQGWEI